MVVCSKCGAEFGNKGLLMTHARREHPKSKPPSTPEPSPAATAGPTTPPEVPRTKEEAPPQPPIPEPPPEPSAEAQQWQEPPMGDNIDNLLNSQVINPQWKFRQPQRRVMYQQQQQPPPQMQQQRQGGISENTITMAVAGLTETLNNYMKMKMLSNQGQSLWDRIGPKLFEKFYITMAGEAGKMTGRNFDKGEAKEDASMIAELLAQQQKELNEVKAQLEIARSPKTIKEPPAENQARTEPSPKPEHNHNANEVKEDE